MCHRMAHRSRPRTLSGWQMSGSPLVAPPVAKILANVGSTAQSLYMVHTLQKAITTMNQLNKEQVCAELGISPRGLENMISRGEFPPPQRLGKRNVWTARAIEAWRERFFHAQEMWMPGNR